MNFIPNAISNTAHVPDPLGAGLQSLSKGVQLPSWADFYQQYD